MFAGACSLTESPTLRVLMATQRGDREKTGQSVRPPIRNDPRRRGGPRDFQLGFIAKTIFQVVFQTRRTLQG